MHTLLVVLGNDNQPGAINRDDVKAGAYENHFNINSVRHQNRIRSVRDVKSDACALSPNPIKITNFFIKNTPRPLNNVLILP